ncbi:hypothetical protein HYDPIDRAFT_118591 [Hydnomerulius pinastri MD-312]|uniref:RmlD-like substrate binding domain-containing protein n=1 Tax=Hydnomerulius pinastri MD-312 TaxID=994086 RepID=A0A0C9W8J9_9AGAM|nr:hypothetical protein HYDPIDRAFT_118591 [Hydnomerulius pinastri MD-312]
MPEVNKRVLVTGASGVLGNAVYHAFKDAGCDVTGLAYSQAKKGLQKLDLSDKSAVEAFFKKNTFDWVIHCAAERRPDAFKEGNPGAKAAAELNAEVPGHLTQLCKAQDSCTLVYISTDYVFDGKKGANIPYKPNSSTNPLQEYGKTKRGGEKAVLDVDGAKVVVLRVPVLYGPAPKNSDSAVNILIDIVKDQSGKNHKMDHYAIRYPTNVLDIANFLVTISGLDKELPRIMHYSADQPFTKYEMCQIFGRILGLPNIDHITSDNSEPVDAVSRPYNCQLSTEETKQVVGDLKCSDFETWWREHLAKQ